MATGIGKIPADKAAKQMISAMIDVLQGVSPKYTCELWLFIV